MRRAAGGLRRRRSSPRALLIAAVLLGVGLGGFFDGIVLHQVLQWHHMVSADYPPTTVASLRFNVLWDGLFHAATYLFTLAGLLLVWRTGVTRPDVRWSHSTAAAGLLIGWGAFNVLEGLVNHHALGIHHVRPGPSQLAYDLGFLAWEAAMLLVGWEVARGEAGAAAAVAERRPAA